MVMMMRVGLQRRYPFLEWPQTWKLLMPPFVLAAVVAAAFVAGSGLSAAFE